MGAIDIICNKIKYLHKSHFREQTPEHTGAAGAKRKNPVEEFAFRKIRCIFCQKGEVDENYMPEM